MSRVEPFVLAATGRMLLDPPPLVYHAVGRHQFPTYPEGIRTGEERGWTKCGVLAEETRPSLRDGQPYHWFRYHGIRMEYARLIGRPCRRCYQ